MQMYLLIAAVAIRHDNYRDFMNIQVVKREQLVTKRTLRRIYLVSFFLEPHGGAMIYFGCTISEHPKVGPLNVSALVVWDSLQSEQVSFWVFA